MITNEQAIQREIIALFSPIMPPVYDQLTPSVEISELLGTIVAACWASTNTSMEISVSVTLPSASRPAVPSILIAGDNGNFTYTDWAHFMFESKAIAALDFTKSVNVSSALDRLASAFSESLRGSLRDIVLGQAWTDVPTYRGVLD